MRKLEEYTLEDYARIRQSYQEHINNCDIAMKRGTFGVDDYEQLVPTLVGITRDVLPFFDSVGDFLERQKINGELEANLARQQAEAYARQVAAEQAATQPVHEVCQLIPAVQEEAKPVAKKKTRK